MAREKEARLSFRRVSERMNLEVCMYVCDALYPQQVLLEALRRGGMDFVFP